MVKVLDVYKEEEKEKTNPVKCVAHLNAALCQLKVNLFQDAKKNCDKALEIEANNVKGLFRRGQVSVLDYLSYSLWLVQNINKAGKIGSIAKTEITLAYRLTLNRVIPQKENETET